MVAQRTSRATTKVFRSQLVSPGKWHGGKGPIASQIVALFPRRCRNPNNPDPCDKGWLHYVEPYYGMGAVLLANDPEGISEVVNDVNKELTSFWRTLKNPAQFRAFQSVIQLTPFSQLEFEAAQIRKGDKLAPVELAIDFFIRCRQSLAGRMKGFTGITRNRTRRGRTRLISSSQRPTVRDRNLLTSRPVRNSEEARSLLLRHLRRHRRPDAPAGNPCPL